MLFQTSEPIRFGPDSEKCSFMKRAHLNFGLFMSDGCGEKIPPGRRFAGFVHMNKHASWGMVYYETLQDMRHRRCIVRGGGGVGVGGGVVCREGGRRAAFTPPFHRAVFSFTSLRTYFLPQLCPGFVPPFIQRTPPHQIPLTLFCFVSGFFPPSWQRFSSSHP